MSTGLIHQDAVHRTAIRALSANGRRESLTTIKWDVSGNCTESREVTLKSRPDNGQFRDVHIPSDGIPTFVDMEVRCRKCPNCLQQRAWKWALRARAEIAAVERTWFATFTLSAEQQYWAAMKAQEAMRGGQDFSLLTPTEQYQARNRIISLEFTKYFKRVRPRTGGSLRYLLVAEQHKSGMPHYHALIHETDRAHPIRKSRLQSNWKLGFTRFKLVDNNAPASYITKYLSKNITARVRASVFYGSPPETAKNERET